MYKNSDRWVSIDGDPGSVCFCSTFLTPGPTGSARVPPKSSNLKIDKFYPQHFLTNSVRNTFYSNQLQRGKLPIFGCSFTRFPTKLLEEENRQTISCSLQIIEAEFWVKFSGQFWAALLLVLAGVSASLLSDRLAMIFEGYHHHPLWGSQCC